MTIDTSLNLPTLIEIIVPVIGVIVWLIRLEGATKANRDAISEAKAAASEAHDDINKRIDAVHAHSTLTAAQLADHKTHVAESYVTKQGMAEQTDRIMKAIADIATRIEGVGARLDRLYDSPPTRRTRSGGQ
jgi:hypothetical protein